MRITERKIRKNQSCDISEWPIRDGLFGEFVGQFYSISRWMSPDKLVLVIDLKYCTLNIFAVKNVIRLWNSISTIFEIDFLGIVQFSC